jgi:uncharacterized protein (DUF488 family)
MGTMYIVLTLFTIGHGARSFKDFVATLRSMSVTLIADVRAFPHSRANPQFNQESLVQALPEHGITYQHWSELGGRRRGLDASPNHVWQNAGFRAYADYMMQPIFWEALDSLLRQARTVVSAVMCSETLWWRCHRRLIADAAVARGADVAHIMKAGMVRAHIVSPSARITEDHVSYTSQQIKSKS